MNFCLYFSYRVRTLFLCLRVFQLTLHNIKIFLCLHVVQLALHEIEMFLCRRVGTGVILYCQDLQGSSPTVRSTCRKRRLTGQRRHLAGTECNYFHIFLLSRATLH